MADEVQGLLSAVQRMAPILRAGAEDAERQGRLPRCVADAVAEAGCYRMLTPKGFGGTELHPGGAFQVIEALSSIDSAIGWNVMASLVILRFVAALPDRTVERFFAHSPDVPFAGTLFPIGSARAVEGGYHVTARGRFGSGSDQAHWILMLATIEQVPADTPRAIGVFFSPDEVVNRRNWFSLGMRSTGSHDVDALDVFIPASRTFPLQPSLPPGKHFQGPLYRYPYIGHTAALVSPVALAIARNAVGALLALVEVEGAATAGKPLRERAWLHANLGRARALIDSARALQRDVIETTWQTVLAGGALTVTQRADLQMAMANAAESSFRAVDLTMRAAGTSGALPKHGLERHFRDIATLRQHAVFSERRFETAGRLYLGLAPEDYPAVIL